MLRLSLFNAQTKYHFLFFLQIPGTLVGGFSAFMAFTCLHGCGKEFPFPLFPIIPCIIFSFIFLFWILPSCILLCGVHSNKSSLFVPWILCWMLQSFTIVLLPVALCLQGIVWGDYQRIKRDEKEKLSRYIRYKFLEITFSSLHILVLLYS